MYDYVIITHLPAFYKVNLYNELAKSLNIYVIFISENTEEKRSNDFVNLEKINFKFSILNVEDFQSRNTFASSLKLLKTILGLNYNFILVSGWDLLEFWIILFTHRKSKLCLALESTILESNINGIKGLIKKSFLSRISTVFASGNYQKKLLDVLGYTGQIKITKGVGIINKPPYIKKPKYYSKKFLFVGRISTEKNIATLVDVFNMLPSCNLTIIGNGPLLHELKIKSNQNITYCNQINNQDLINYYLNSDFLILPSLSETWGIVVDEALYFELPVILSDKCGASELVKNNINGYVFNPNSRSELKDLILKFNNDNYSELISNLANDQINSKDLIQVDIYKTLIQK